MNISVFCSKKFLVPLRVMLLSFLKNNNYEKHNIFIVNTELEDEDIHQLNKDINKYYNQKVVSLKIDKEFQKLFIEKTRFREAAFYKLYMFRNLPIDADRMLCLDADMVVRGSLKEFYYQDLEGNILAACDENKDYYDEKHMREIGITPEENYYNVGVLLVDLKKYLQEYTVEEYAEWYNQNIDKAIYVAQDILNVFFKGRIKLWDSYLYNNQIIYSSKFSKDQLLSIREKVKVIHYVGPIKPDDYRYECDLRLCYIDILKEYGYTAEVIKIFINRFIKRNITRCRHIIDRIKRR